jgi:hypothetical protein
MNEQEVRALVREAIERHLGRPEKGVRPLFSHVANSATHQKRGLTPFPDPSHIMLNVLPGSDMDDGMCLIEPVVRCNHCGFCQSYGH